MMQKVSKMLIDIAGGFITDLEYKEEVSAHLEITRTAWNIAILPKEKRKSALKKYINKQAKYAPSQEELEALKLEMLKLIENKITKYPSVRNKVEKAEVVDRGDEFVVRAYFRTDRGSVGELLA